MLEILMMTPAVPRPAMRAAASRPHRNTPVRLTAMTCCQSASDIVSTTSPSRAFTNRPSRVMPALLIRPSTGPIACSSESNAAATAASSETSATAVAWPLPGSDAAASASASASRSIRPMRAPAVASAAAMARPSPRAAPVMMMCLSTMSMQPLLVIWLFGYLVIWLFGYFVAWWRRVGGSGFVFGFVARDRRLERLGPEREHALLKPAVRFDRGRAQPVQPGVAQRLGKSLLQRLLLRLEVGHDFFEVIARHVAHRIGIDPNHGLEKIVAEHRPAEHFLVGHDLQQHLPGDVGTGLGLDHLHRVAGPDHVTDVFQVDRLAGLGVVKAPVGVLLDDSLRAGHDLFPIGLVQRLWGVSLADPESREARPAQGLIGIGGPELNQALLAPVLLLAAEPLVFGASKKLVKFRFLAKSCPSSISCSRDSLPIAASVSNC